MFDYQRLDELFIFIADPEQLALRILDILSVRVWPGF